MIYSSEEELSTNAICDPGLISVQITSEDQINVIHLHSFILYFILNGFKKLFNLNRKFQLVTLTEQLDIFWSEVFLLKIVLLI